MATRGPVRVPVDAPPERVTIYEVGRWGGLHNERAVIPAAVKAEFIERLMDAGRSYGLPHGRGRRRGARASAVLSVLGWSSDHGEGL